MNDAPHLSRAGLEIVAVERVVDRSVMPQDIVARLRIPARPVRGVRLAGRHLCLHPGAEAVAQAPDEPRVIIAEDVLALIRGGPGHRGVGHVSQHHPPDDRGGATGRAILGAIVLVAGSHEVIRRGHTTLGGNKRKRSFEVGPAEVEATALGDIQLLVFLEADISDEQSPRGLVDVKAEWIPETCFPHQPAIDVGAGRPRIAGRDEQRLVRGSRSVRQGTHIEPQYHAVEPRRVGRRAGDGIFAEADVEHRVWPEPQGPAAEDFGHAGDVADQFAAGSRHDRHVAAVAVGRVTCCCKPRDPQGGIDRRGQHVNERFGGPARVHGNTEETLFATRDREAIHDSDGVDGREFAIDDHAQAAGQQLTDDQTAIGQEREARRPIKPRGEHLVLESRGQLCGGPQLGRAQRGQTECAHECGERPPERRQRGHCEVALDPNWKSARGRREH